MVKGVFLVTNTVPAGNERRFHHTTCNSLFDLCSDHVAWRAHSVPWLVGRRDALETGRIAPHGIVLCTVGIGVTLNRDAASAKLVAFIAVPSSITHTLCRWCFMTRGMV